MFNGSYAGFVKPAAAERLAGSGLGTVLPFSFDPELELVVDPEVLAVPRLYFNAARLDRSVALDSADYRRVADPRLASIAGPAEPCTSASSSNEAAAGAYDIRLDDKFGLLTLIDVDAVAAAHEPWFNQTLTTVDESVVRVGVVEGEFHWHRHDDTDEFFLVLDGQLHVDIDDAPTVDLDHHQAVTVPRGTRHRTRADGRTTILMVERTSVSPTGT